MVTGVTQSLIAKDRARSLERRESILFAGTRQSNEITTKNKVSFYNWIKRMDNSGEELARGHLSMMNIIHSLL